MFTDATARLMWSVNRKVSYCSEAESLRCDAVSERSKVKRHLSGISPAKNGTFALFVKSLRHSKP